MSTSEKAFAHDMGRLWALPPPGPDNLLYAPEFLDLRERLISRFGKPLSPDGLSSALWNALRSLGLPCTRPTTDRTAPISPSVAATRLLDAFTRTTSKRIHLCPLDLADDLPSLDLGGVRVGRLTPKDLAALVDAPKLERWGRHYTFPVARLSAFQWLIVEEAVTHTVEPGHRALPMFYEPFPDDFAKIDPHETKHPQALQRALFGLIALPWESWTDTAFDWRPFRIRWVYTADEDLFARPQAAPAADALTWTERPRPDGDSEEEPEHLSWAVNPGQVEAAATPQRVATAIAALDHPLLQIPAPHFMVSAFAADGVDQFLHHITAIEAALGSPDDYPRRGVPKPTVHPRVSGRARVQTRIVGLLGDTTAGDQFHHLFELRSAFLHGRPMDPIAGPDRVLARTLARRVIEGLIAITADRATHLDALLDKGVALSRASRKP